MFSVLGSIGSSIASAFAGDYFAKKQGERNYGYSQNLQNNSQSFARSMADQSWARQQAENRWMWNEQKQEARYWALHGHEKEVEALRRAGLNPILAATGGFNGASAPMMKGSSNPTMGSAGTNNASSSAARADFRLMQDYAALKLLNSQQQNIDTDTAKKAAEVATTLSKKQSVDIDNSAKSLQLKLDKRNRYNNPVFKNVLDPISDVFRAIPIISKFMGAPRKNVTVHQYGE